MSHPCPDGCGRSITNWTKACFPIPPWDTPGLPSRTMDDRCQRHKRSYGGAPLCAYRDDDPARCAWCHAKKCAGCTPVKKAVRDQKDES